MNGDHGRQGPDAVAGTATFAAALALALALAGPARGAEIYRSVGSDGVVSYGDRPLSEADAIEVQGAGTRTPARPETERRVLRERLLRAFEHDREERRERAAQRARARQQARQQALRCADAREQLQAMSDAGRMYEHGAGGERVFLSQQERAKRIALMRRYVGALCG